MTLFITKVPDFNPVRNPVRFKVAADGPVTTPGANPDWRIETENGIGFANVGQVLTLTFGTVEIAFSAVSSPDPLLGQYWGTTAATVADSLEDALAANYWIQTHYYVVRSSATSIQMLGFETGTKYGLTNVVITNNSPSVMGFLPFGAGGLTGIEAVVAPNYGVLMQVWVEETYRSNEYTLKLEELYPVNNAGTATSDIARALRAYLPDPFIPHVNMNTAFRMDGSFKRFMVRAAERYGDPAVVYALKESRGHHFYLAGRSEIERVADEWGDRLLDADSRWRFLTNWPNTSAKTPKRVRASQREFLCVLVQDGSMDKLVVRADIYYTDYTVAMGTYVDDYAYEGDVQTGELVAFPVGVEQMGLDDFVPAKTISHYTIYITDFLGTTVYTEKRYYRLDREHHEHLRQFHYLSSAGGIDTLALVGPRNETTDVEMTRSNRYVPVEPDSILDARDNADVLEGVNTVMELGTEHLHQDELEALRDLLGSERIVERVNGEHWPVQLLVNKLELQDEAGSRMPAKLKYRYALRNTANTLGT